MDSALSAFSILRSSQTRIFCPAQCFRLKQVSITTEKNQVGLEVLVHIEKMISKTLKHLSLKPPLGLHRRETFRCQRDVNNILYSFSWIQDIIIYMPNFTHKHTHTLCSLYIQWRNKDRYGIQYVLLHSSYSNRRDRQVKR